MASWRPLGTSWRQLGALAAKTALEALLGGSWGGLGGSWAALGASLGRLGPARRSPGGPGRLRGRAPGGHFGAFLDGPGPDAEKAAQNFILQRFLKVCWSGFWLGCSPYFCLRGTRPAKQPTSKNNENHLFLWVASHSRVFRGHRTGQEI